jgi:hypothetical protein
MTFEVVSAEVRPTQDGTLGVWVEFEVDEDEWEHGGGDLLQGCLCHLPSRSFRWQSQERRTLS